MDRLNDRNVTPTTSLKPDRKTVERNRRIHMKYLCGKLVSLIPLQHLRPPRDLVSQQDQLDQAIAYIKQLRERVEKLEEKKKRILVPAAAVAREYEEEEEEESSGKMMIATGTAPSLKSPILHVRDLGSALEVNLICDSTTNFILHQVIRIVEDEGAQVVSAIFSSVGDKVFYTLHAQVRVTRLGMDASEVAGRLKKLITQLQAT